MEIYNLQITAENPKVAFSDTLTAEKTVELVLASNRFAFKQAKKYHLSTLAEDPLMISILVSSLAADWVFKEHGHSQDQFKSAIFSHKVYESIEVAKMMTTY